VLSTHNGVPVVVDDFSYPLGINFTELDPSGESCQSTLYTLPKIPSQTTFSTVKSTFDHSYNRDLLPLPIVAGSRILERQTASVLLVPLLMKQITHRLQAGFFFTSPTGNTGNGTNSNTFSYSDQAGNTYSRVVDAVLNKITFDEQTGSLAPLPMPRQDPLQPFTGFTGKIRLPGGRKLPGL
jgi:hypothetical protein